MPRSPNLVAHELTAHGCELPQENLDALAFFLWPDEVVLAALAGGGEEVGFQMRFVRYDELLLVLTNWRVHIRGYKHRRDRSWQLEEHDAIPWQRMENFSGLEPPGEGVAEVRLRCRDFSGSGGMLWDYHTCRFSKGTLDQERFANFINAGQRQLQAVTFASAGAHPCASPVIPDHMERLVSLRQQGHLSEQEFEQAKRKILYG